MPFHDEQHSLLFLPDAFSGSWEAVQSVVSTRQPRAADYPHTGTAALLTFGLKLTFLFNVKQKYFSH